MGARDDGPAGKLREAVLLQEQQHADGRADLLQLAGTVYAIVDLLVQKGLLTRDEIAAAHAAARGRLDRDVPRRRLFVINEDPADKYAPRVNREVDCEGRIPLCRAVCCTLQVPLSEQDLEEGVASWDVGRPFFLSKDADRRCCHQDRPSGGCTIYPQRPLTCRTYVCIDDRRIWRDFEARIPNEKGIAALLAQESRRRPRLASPAAGEAPERSPASPPLDEEEDRGRRRP